MRPTTLVWRGLVHYWRTNLAVTAGVATAVAVLAGALLVGESVRTSLRNIVLDRLGNTGSALASNTFLRAELAAAFDDATPLISLTGVARDQATGRFAAGVNIYAVDDRFWSFHRTDRSGPPRGEAWLSEPLAEELGIAEGDGLLVGFEEQSYIPAESVHGRKEDSTRTLRFTFAGVVPREEAGEFSLAVHQGTVKAVFVSLEDLQSELGMEGQANLILVAPEVENPPRILSRSFALADMGLRLLSLPAQGVIQIEARSGILPDSLAAVIEQTIRNAGFQPTRVLTYLANTMRQGDREIPYSLVAATSEVEPADSEAQIFLNRWAARDLGASIGDTIELDYYLWRDDNRLETASASFRLAGVRPLERDAELAPEYPGITDSEDVTDWDPPFPVDLNRIRPQDEEYWDEYRTTPKAFLPLDTGQELWSSRWGSLTAIRVPVPSEESAAGALSKLQQELLEAINPLEHGLRILPARQLGLEGSRGATDFGEYFVYFSFFLVVSALLLAGLFFRLGVEQRVRETGLLEAVGIPPAQVLRLFAIEGLVLAILGALLGCAGAIAYCELILYGLRTWWVDAVGTTDIELAADPLWLAAGALGGVIAAFIALFLTLRSLGKISPRSRLGGVVAPVGHASGRARRFRQAGAASGVLAFLLLGSAATGVLPQAAGFFGAGTLLLIAALCFLRVWIEARGVASVGGAGLVAVLRLGFRNAAYRPGRTVLAVGLLAAAIFLIIAVDSFRLTEPEDLANPQSPTGGFRLIAESALPVYQNPSTGHGREALALDDLEEVSIVPFRLRAGDDVSCLNLYRPENPRVLGATRDFLESNRFRFQASLAGTEAERANPWRLLMRPPADGVIPAAVAANSMTYILHRELGDTIEIPVAGRTVRLRLVAALADSVFQRELIISEENFRSAFADLGGYRVFLIETPEAAAQTVTDRLEDYLSDYGFDVVSTRDTLARFHRIENTYLSTFQSLGGLGLLLGTVGLAVVLLRNVLERRRELALLRAVGFRPGDLALTVIAENVLIVLAGIVIGSATAVVAIVPALAGRGGTISPLSLLLLLGGIFAIGLLSSVAATRAATRAPLLAALRSE